MNLGLGSIVKCNYSIAMSQRLIVCIAFCILLDYIDGTALSSRIYVLSYSVYLAVGTVYMIGVDLSVGREMIQYQKKLTILQ